MLTYKGRKVYITGNGYSRVYWPGHPLAAKKGNIYLHRLVWYEHHGAIPRGCEIHHIDGNKSNNQIENLEMLTSEEHSDRHREISCRYCETCNTLFQPRNRYIRCCSRACASVKGGLSARKLHPITCEICKVIFRPQSSVTKCCSKSCSCVKNSRKRFSHIKRPTALELGWLLATMSQTAIAAKFSVARKTVGNWARTYDLL